MEWIRLNAPIIQALTAIASFVVAASVYLLARQQTQSARLNAIREIMRQHHSREMRELRRTVRVDLVNWIESGQTTNDNDPKWLALKSAYEDILNYYEYLGSLLKDKLVDPDIILRTTHNSALAIWDIHQRYGERIRPPTTRGPDFAGEFAYLVERVREYRRAKGF